MLNRLELTGFARAVDTLLHPPSSPGKAEAADGQASRSAVTVGAGGAGGDVSGEWKADAIVRLVAQRIDRATNDYQRTVRQLFKSIKKDRRKLTSLTSLIRAIHDQVDINLSPSCAKTLQTLTALYFAAETWLYSVLIVA